MSELTKTLVNKPWNLHSTGDLVHLDFLSLYPEENQKKNNLRVVMDTQQAVALRDSLNALLQKIQKTSRPQKRSLEERYSPRIFSVTDMDAAKRIILTKEGPSGSEERWQKETPALMRILANYWKLEPGAKVVDYGCGIGRISKELCKLGCYVVGVDISPEMRQLAIQYVSDKNHFIVVSPKQFTDMLNKGFQCDYACAIWVLQHCLKPYQDLASITGALKWGGELFVVNNKFSRAVPVADGPWQNDNINIWQLCHAAMKELRILGFPEGVGVDARHFQCGFYSKL